MLLAKLVELHQARAAEDRGTNTALPPAYQMKPVPWVINLDTDGRFLGITRTSGTTAGRGRDRGKETAIPALATKRTVNVAAVLLADRADYALGREAEGVVERAKGRVIEGHTRFVGLVQGCATGTAEPTVKAVDAFLRSLDLSTLTLPNELGPQDLVTFAVDGAYPIALPSVQAWWRRQVAGRDTASAVACIVCGRVLPPVDRDPVLIKGIRGGQASGMALVSANAISFYSYGLEAAWTAPHCRECAEAYGNALNGLLADDRTSLRLGQVAYVFWTRDAALTFTPAPFFSDPRPEDVGRLLAAPWTGKTAAVEETQPDTFYAAALTASGARVVVRDWIETTVSEAQTHLRRYFLLQGLPGQDPFSLVALCRGLAPPRGRGGARSALDAVPPSVPRALVRAALAGGVLPDSLIALAVRRMHARRQDEPWSVFQARIALIKMVLLSGKHENDIPKEGEMDTESQQDVAYLCGRAFALVEQAQHVAIPSARATVVDRFYGAASSTPGSVFGLLLRNAQNHLSKVKDVRPGAYVNIQRDLGEVLAGIQDFPRTLTLRQQGLFALGYYYERNKRFRRGPEGQDGADQEQS